MSCCIDIRVKRKLKIPCMNNFTIVTSNEVRFFIDTVEYSSKVIARTLYWLSGKFTVQSERQGNNCLVTLQSSTTEDWDSIKCQISQHLADFRLREIIEDETRDIRNILYIKAFSNLNDFVEYGDEE